MHTRPVNPTVNALAVTGGLMAAYALLALLSTLAVAAPLGLPLIWLPAGFATAAVATLGARQAAPGVGLGALITTLAALLAEGVAPAQLVVALAIASGAVAQALAARMLHRRLSGLWAGAGRRAPAIVAGAALLALAAAAAGTIDASIGTTALALGGLLPPAAYGAAWGGAWLGNTLGILLAAPPLLGLGARLRTWPAPRRIALVVIDIGLILSAGLFFILWQEETDRIATEFSGDAEAAALALRSTVREYQHDVDVLHAFYTASSAVTRAEFRSFVQLHMRGAVSAPGLQALVWAPVVPADERDAFEAAVRREGLATFMIYERDDAGRPVRAGARAAYVVATYNEPIAARQGLGFDLSSEPTRRAALEQARDTGQAAATAPTRLVLDGAPGFLIVWPIYSPDAPTDTVAARRAGLRGYVLGAFRAQSLLDTAMQAPKLHDIDAYLFDHGPAGGAQLLAARPAASRPAPAAGTQVEPLLAGLHYTSTFEVAGRSWRLIARPAPAFSARRRTWVPWVALLTGLASSAWVARTLAQRHEDAEALRRSEERFRAMIEKSANAISLIGADGTIIYNSPNYQALLGYDPGRWIGSSALTLVHPDDLPEVADMLGEVLRTPGLSRTGVFRVQHQDGSWRWLESTGTNLLDDPAVRAVVVNIRDITERKLREDEIRRLNSELELRVAERTADLSQVNAELSRALRAKDEFLATMSHELRTPLNGILAFAELLQEQHAGPLNERQIRSVQHIETSGRHLLALINDILDLSKIEAGHMDIQLDQCWIAEICEASLLFVREVATRKGLRLSFVCDDETALMEVDAKRLKQMLVNLLSNAVKFTPSGGQVRLRMAADAAQGAVRFTVEDSGIGIAPGDMGRLFTPFTQLDSSLARQHEGTGLGLALVRRLADLLGGSIHVASDGEGRGSCFTLSLPWRRPPPAAPPAPPPAHGEPITHALVIEDSPSAAGQIAGYLRDMGIQVTAMAQAEGLAERLLALRPDVIFLDLILPGESGWEALRHLKESPLTRDVPVIVISVIDEPARGLAAGAAAYIVKPLTREALLAALGQATTPPQPIAQALIPAPQAAAAARAQRAQEALILLAEDNEVTISVISDYLLDQGYRVVVARNGSEALARAAEATPDLILMDIQMPVLDGLAATRQLRGLPACAATPIVALTALAMPGDRERCMAAGANAYLSKPVSLRDLAALIARLLEEAG